MGQYYYVVNVDKKQYLHPHRFDDGLKAREFGSGGKTMQALHALLTKSDSGGGGDYNHASDDYGIIGSWAYDRIVIIGDYDSSNLYEKCYESYEEISSKVLPVIRAAYDGDD